MQDIKLCYVVVLIVAVVFLIYGLVQVLKKREADESSDGEVMSRQLRGFGYVLLSQIVLLIGMSLCMGLLGGMRSLTSPVFME